MSERYFYLGEIRLLSYQQVPAGWLPCDGRRLLITENQALFQVLGTKFGGDGTTNFALPDLRGRTIMHQSSQFPLASAGGSEKVALEPKQIPAHQHRLLANDSDPNPVFAASGNIPGPGVGHYRSLPPDSTLIADTVETVGASQPHENMQPFLVLGYVIATYGIYPS